MAINGQLKAVLYNSSVWGTAEAIFKWNKKVTNTTNNTTEISWDIFYKGAENWLSTQGVFNWTVTIDGNNYSGVAGVTIDTTGQLRLTEITILVSLV